MNPLISVLLLFRNMFYMTEFRKYVTASFIIFVCLFVCSGIELSGRRNNNRKIYQKTGGSKLVSCAQNALEKIHWTGNFQYRKFPRLTFEHLPAPTDKTILSLSLSLYFSFKHSQIYLVVRNRHYSLLMYSYLQRNFFQLHSIIFQLI